MFSMKQFSTKMKQFSMKQFLETKTGKVIYVGCVTLTLSAIASWAVLAHQDSPSTVNHATSTKSRPATGDAHFAKEAAQGGMAEVKLGQLAQEKGSNAMVRSFGKRMVDDHRKAGDKLKEVASRESIALPTDISAKDQATYDSLAKLNGAFDRAYARDMVKDHETDVAAFQKEANAGKDDSLKSFAAETLPTLQEHLKQAKEMMKTVGGTTAAKGTKTKANGAGR
jgi:putative membrane protein